MFREEFKKLISLDISLKTAIEEAANALTTNIIFFKYTRQYKTENSQNELCEKDVSKQDTSKRYFIRLLKN